MNIPRELQELLDGDENQDHCCNEYDACGGCIATQTRVILGLPVDKYDWDLLSEAAKNRLAHLGTPKLNAQ